MQTQDPVDDTIFYDVFSAGAVTKADSAAPAAVRVASSVAGAFSTAAAIDSAFKSSGDTTVLPFEFSWFPKNPLFANSVIEIVPPSSTVWDEFDEASDDDIILECTSGCKKNGIG